MMRSLIPGPRLRAAARALISHRLFHFAVLGGLTFAVAPPPRDDRIIEVPRDRVRDVVALAARQKGGATLPPEQRDAAVEQYVRDEMLYREALRLHLDEEDAIVRNRLIQKMLFFAEEAAGGAAPVTDEVLRAFYARAPQRWQRAPTVRLEHVFVSATAHPPAYVTELRARLEAGGSVDGAGDPFPLTRSGAWKSPEDLERDFGATVAAQVAGLAVGAWSPPLRSTYGWHLVRVAERRPGRQATFDEARKVVRTAYQRERKREALEALYRRLEQEYEVRVAPGADGVDSIARSGSRGRP